ncbi:hypothetical protein RM844_19015 [Streptomyces sp. DSM 44915]|uniref:Uncharacterized protein n=1 Tax=Streptomyces chisholmiae TaxID=3075540 RepID=A0ABU2JUG0_9ACTN|nr:hypothetical protein [Streptomyces sp. DSM 44915]MDT0268378.1 hypothetical protein [Streptomyces sp. DSM 44915]
MDTRPPRVLLTVTLALSFLVCVAFLVHHVGAGLYPDDLASWLEENAWLMWTAVVLTLANAVVLPVLWLAAESGERR